MPRTGRPCLPATLARREAEQRDAAHLERLQKLRAEGRSLLRRLYSGEVSPEAARLQAAATLAACRTGTYGLEIAASE
jgi:hypothetical protein